MAGVPIPTYTPEPGPIPQSVRVLVAVSPHVPYSRGMTNEETPTKAQTFMVNGYELEKWHGGYRMSGELCWQVYTAGSTASIYIRKIPAAGRGKNRTRTTYHLYYFSLIDNAPNGRMVFAHSDDAYRVAKELGGIFAPSESPRGD